MIFVAEQQLKRVRTKRQSYRRFGLPRSEVKVVEIVRDGLVERWQGRIDQNMMMTRVGLLNSGRCDAHVHQPEPHLHLGPHVRAAGGMYKIDLRAGRRRVTLPSARRRRSRPCNNADFDAR